MPAYKILIKCVQKNIICNLLEPNNNIQKYMFSNVNALKLECRGYRVEQYAVVEFFIVNININPNAVQIIRIDNCHDPFNLQLLSKETHSLENHS